jgi:hypothetical protein
LLSQLTGGCSAQPEQTREEDDEYCLGGPAFHLFLFFHYIWGRREYMSALWPQCPSHPPPSPCSRTTQCRTTRTQRHDAHAVRAQSASCGSGQTPRLTLYLAGKKETKDYKHLGTELLTLASSIEMSRCCLVHSFTSGMTHEQDSRDDSRARPELRSFKATFNKIFSFD